LADPSPSVPRLGDRRRRPLRAGLLAAALLPLGLGGCGQGILDPQGPVAGAERTILFNSIGIMLTIVVPTILAVLGVAWWQRASNGRARYLPTWSYSGKIEIVVWSIPAMVILLLGGIAWIGSHDLDPPKPLASKAPPVEVEVVSLDWKWLFIYPEQGVASVNRLVVPAGRPVSLHLTSDSVMNSFFVPQLGGQIYTMAGMTTRLNLSADHPGHYPGLSSQFSGDGFSGMRFVVDAVPEDQFAAWTGAAHGGGGALDAGAYAALARPSRNVAPRTFGAVSPGLFAWVAGGKPAMSPPPAIPSPAQGAPLGADHKGH